MNISRDTTTYKFEKEIPITPLIHLYKKNKWSSAEKPSILQKALMCSARVVSAWDEKKLIGLGNAITDNHLVVYYPHLLVLPEYQNRGIGTEIMTRLMQPYSDFHQHMVVADANAIQFYKKLGFTKASKTQSMWIYSGNDH